MDIKKEYGDANHGLSTLQFIKRRKCAATSRDEDFLPPPPLRPMRRWHHSLVPALVYRYRAQTGVLAQIEVPPRTGIPAAIPGGRSEERRVGKECVSTLSSRRAPFS